MVGSALHRPGLLQGDGVTSYSCVLHSGVLSSIGKIFKEEGLLGFFVYVSLYAPELATGHGSTNRHLLNLPGRSCRPQTNHRALSPPE